MLNTILNKATDTLASIGLFTKVYAIADRVTDGTRTYPAYNGGGGEYTPLEYDTTNGMAYFRKAGKVGITEDKDIQMTSCGDIFYDIRYPVRLVCLIPKDKADCNNSFADDYFANRIISTLSNDAFTGVENAISVRFTATGYESDNIKVLQEEYSNYKEIKDINYQWSYLAIDFIIEVQISKECLSPC